MVDQLYLSEIFAYTNLQNRKIINLNQLLKNINLMILIYQLKKC